MSQELIEEVERGQIFRQAVKDLSAYIFATKGSSGKNSERLARVLSAYDMLMTIMGWQDKPIAELSKIVTQYQASIDGSYHRDFKDIQIAEEVERRRANRKGFSITAQ